MTQFDLIVIGSGTGNSIIDERFADQRVALVERSSVFGGLCLNAGCIPTKMFVHPADVLDAVREGPKIGLEIPSGHAQWSAIRDRVFGRIDAIAAAGKTWRESNDNVTLFEAEARFVGPRTLAVGEEEISAPNIVIATGSSARIPNVPGLSDVAVAGNVHTSDTIMRLDSLPKSLVILGGGYVASEFAHIFASYGSKVTVVHRGSQMLRREDAEISEMFTADLGARCRLRFGHRLRDMQLGHRGVAVGTIDEQGVEYEFEAEQALFALGRTPNSAALDPTAGGIDVDDDGFIVVDDYQRTSADGVWALGDVSNRLMLKHVANHEARTVAHNIVHPDDLIVSRRTAIPHAVFSAPQVAAVGLTEEQAVAQGVRYASFTQAYADVAYGWATEDEGHVIKVLVDPDSGLILGAHILGPHASVLLQPLVQAMAFGLDALTMARGQFWVHPSATEVVENALLGVALP